MPLLVVLPTLAASLGLGLRAYGSMTHCWLATDRGFIWAFAGSVLAVVTANCIVFGLAMAVTRGARSRNTVP